MVGGLLSTLSLQSLTGQRLSAVDQHLLRELARGASHGQRIVKTVRAARLHSEPYVARTTYTTLHHLERRGLVASEWRPVHGRQIHVKFYWLTVPGIRALRQHPLEHVPMHIDERMVTTLVLIAMFSHGGEDVAASRARHPIVTLAIDARVRIRLDELGQATVAVTRILGAIGVDVAWVDQTAPPDRDSSTRKEASFGIRVLILARAHQSDADSVPLGFSPAGTKPCGADVVVFKEHVDEFARVHGRSASFVLGLVIVHEIGHVFLPIPAHTTAGIMQAPWDHDTMAQADEPGLMFTSRQGALIRTRLNRNCLSTAPH
jgi:DNA-binding PadR family transcriptional regulator